MQLAALALALLAASAEAGRHSSSSKNGMVRQARPGSNSHSKLAQKFTEQQALTGHFHWNASLLHSHGHGHHGHHHHNTGHKNSTVSVSASDHAAATASASHEASASSVIVSADPISTHASHLTSSGSIRETTSARGTKVTSHASSASSTKAVSAVKSSASTKATSIKHSASTKATPHKSSATAKATSVKSSAASKATSSAKHSASATPAKASSKTSSASSTFAKAALKDHNQFRAKYGAKALVWDNALAAKAQKWANNCVFEHSGGSLGPYGENIAAGYSDITTAIAGWTGEASSYNAKSPVASHFTQVVWKGTTHLGCAQQTCKLESAPFNGAKAPFYVCEYSTAGNVFPASNFAKNVGTLRS